MAAPAVAQTTGAFTERPDDALSRNLRSLAANPKSVTALMGAGKAALELGDPQAALTFFARAEEQLPRDGRVKMWIGSALVQLQQPHAALKFFRDAADLGVPAAELAGDRGLAHDIAGNPREAQREYRIALQRGRDDEVTRRLALSLAISGEREPALRLLEDQLLVRDRAAERARALILALTGDSMGAARAVQAAMPGPQAGAMAPFLARLPSLSPAERALAVHLGIFPNDGRSAAPTTFAQSDFASAVTDAGRPDPAQSLLQRRQAPPEPVSTDPRRRPDVDSAASSAGARTASRPPVTATFKPPAAATPSRTSSRSGASGANPAWAWSRGGAPTSLSVRREAEAKPKPAQAAPAPHETLVAEAGTTESRTAGATVEAPAPGFAEPSVAAPTAEVPAEAQPRPAEIRPAGTDPVAPPPRSEGTPAGSRLADLSAALAQIAEPERAPGRTASAKPKPVTTVAAGKPQNGLRGAAVTSPAKKPKPAPAPADPSRVWVQIAGGADKGSLPREYARLKAKAPKLLGAHAAWTAPLNASNRLLVGPFASAKEAQAFVNQLKAQSLSGFAWTSAAGQKVEKLPAK